MRFSALFPFICALAALVLSLLCLFAGSKPSFLPQADLLTLNISRLGHTPLFNTSDGGNFFTNLVNDLEKQLNKLVDDAESDIAGFFDLHDFYSAHIMNYCEGYYKPNTNARHASENVTRCSNTTTFFHFDPTVAIKNELKPGVNLTDIKWPHEIEEAAHAISLAAKVMFVFYLIGIIFSGLAVLGATLGILSSGRISAFFNFVLDFVAFLTMAIASIISTVIMVKAVNAVNKYGHEIGIAAYKGKEFLGMTWAATAIMLLASVVWVFECVKGRKARQYGGEKSVY